MQMHKGGWKRDRLKRVRISSATDSSVVKEIDCPVHRSQLRSLLLRLIRSGVSIGLLDDGSHSEETDRHEQAGRDAPRQNSSLRAAHGFELSLETPEFGKARRARSQVQPGRMIGRQAILRDVL